MVRYYLGYAIVLITTIVLGGIATIVGLVWPDVVMHLGRLWSRINMIAFGGRMRVEGHEHATSSRPCVYVSNHQSLVDIWVIILLVPQSTRFVAKQVLFRIPFLGWALWVSGFIPVDRANRKRALESIDNAARRIRDGRSVVLFAEGTRTPGDRLAPFKKGPFHLALRSGVPVVPVVIQGSGAVVPSDGKRCRPGTVTIRFLPPIDSAPFQPRDVDGLLEAVRTPMEAAVEAHQATVHPPTAATA